MSGATVFHGGLVVDGSGSEPVALDVEVRDGVITRVAPVIDGGDERIDLHGETLLPGLIDVHVHAALSSVDPLARRSTPFSYEFHATARNLARLLDCGITTARDAGGTDLGTVMAIRDGLIAGPDLRIAITMLSQTGGHADGWNVDGSCSPLLPAHPGRPAGVADGPDQLRQRVREIIRAGADVIKICTTGGVSSERDDPAHAQFTMDEVHAVVSEANAAGRSVMAHAQGRQGILNAIDAGVRSIEHGIYADDECFDRMRERGVWLVPTLSAPYQMLTDLDAGRAQVSERVEAKFRAVTDTHTAMFERAVKAGVRIAMGTDSGVFTHGRNLDELMLMKRGGMTGAEVLRSATSEAAALLELDDRGRIAEGLRADLVTVAGDPLDFDGYRERITSVWKGGRAVLPMA